MNKITKTQNLDIFPTIKQPHKTTTISILWNANNKCIKFILALVTRRFFISIHHMFRSIIAIVHIHKNKKIKSHHVNP